MCTEIVVLSEIVNDTISNSSGFQLCTVLKENFDQGNKVQLSLKDCGPMTSSFMNSSFGEILESFGIDYIRKNLTLINYKMSHAEAIKEYMEESWRYS